MSKTHKNLTNAQNPAILSLWEKVTENPVQEVTNPNLVSKKQSRYHGFKNKVPEKRDKLAFEYVKGRKCRV